MQIIHYPLNKKILDEKIFFYDSSDDSLLKRVGEIVKEVAAHGDEALLGYTQKFDGVALTSENIRMDLTKTKINYHNLHPDFEVSLNESIENISAFHKLQLPKDINYVGKYGEHLGQRFTPVDVVGVYVPGGAGGETPLVSTLLMNVIPAQIAGVKKIVVITPPMVGGKINPHLHYALNKLNIKEIYWGGGAQAIAALAYGTETIPAVDMIVGPGNRYVNTAKKIVFGKVMIDSLSGHSEIVIWADSSSRPDWVAADLLSQAEHAGGELTILVTEDENYAHEVVSEVNKQTEKRERRDLIRSSLTNRGLVVLVNNKNDAVEVINHIAPEHIEVLLPEAEKLAYQVKHAGAIFIGDYASEPIGDYICGTNHVLPTNRSARFSSPLGVYTFLKRSNLIHYNEEAFNAYAKSASVLAEVEKLTAHKYALKIRKSNKKIEL